MLVELEIPESFRTWIVNKGWTWKGGKSIYVPFETPIEVIGYFKTDMVGLELILFIHAAPPGAALIISGMAPFRA